VFAVRDIPSGTTLCPYVGVVQKQRCQDEACDYCLMLRRGLYLCARNILYDEGYFAACHVDTPFCRKEVVNEERPMPPNYGRTPGVPRWAERLFPGDAMSRVCWRGTPSRLRFRLCYYAIASS
jgi:hypothetical protein